jgi:hypothetical protein
MGKLAFARLNNSSEVTGSTGSSLSAEFGKPRIVIDKPAGSVEFILLAGEVSTFNDGCEKSSQFTGFRLLFIFSSNHNINL